MARRELGPAALSVAQAVARSLDDARGPVVVACSGGPDSLALAAGTAWVARHCDIEPLAVCVDHGLQRGSRDVAERAAAQCRALGMEAEVVAVHVEERGDGPEAAARVARYVALERYPGPILLGHTLDDQAETVLLRLARGGGTRALAAMAPRSGRLRRPLLGLRRALVAHACDEWGLDPWHDPHNDDPRFARVRARRELLPLLEASLGPGLAESLARTAAQARADADALDAIAAGYELPAVLPAAVVAGEPDALKSRLLLRWLRERGCPGGADALARVAALVDDWHGQGPIDVAGGAVRRRDEALHWEPRG